jgi:3',5'-cyclic AMP phosphodiesterase CpdA
MKIGYTTISPKNTAPTNAKNITIFDGKTKICDIDISKMKPSDLGKKLYSFGALSDVHVVYDTAAEDFRRALSYLNNDIDVAFTCICGDLTNEGIRNELAQYKAIVDECSADTPVYAITGNHEMYASVCKEFLYEYTGRPLYYSFAQGDDVFVMVGEYQWANYALFEEGELQWLYETLEANRNKRCFVFFHVFPWGDSGNANGLYGTDLFTGTQGKIFQNLMKHYKNTILFHGHSHLKFDLQEIDKKANYNETLGYRSVHIPSLAVPRDSVNGEITTIYAESEGYVVDVYENHVVLRGRDFVKGEFIPIAQYCLDTTLIEIPANTFVDDTGTIKTT